MVQDACNLFQRLTGERGVGGVGHYTGERRSTGVYISRASRDRNTKLAGIESRGSRPKARSRALRLFRHADRWVE